MRAATTVILTSPQGDATVVRAGEEFPAWATVTNPAAIADEVKAPVEKPEPEPESEPEPEAKAESEPEAKPAARRTRKSS